MKELNKENLYDIIAKAVVEEITTLQETFHRKEYVPVSISARHIHLQQEHIDVLFGKGYLFTKYKEISQPGQYACEEKVTIKGPKAMIENVRVLAPIRKQTQVEISMSDARKLGISPPVRNSGNLKGSAPITVMGPKGSVNLAEGCIIADRHIHMTPEDAKSFGVTNLQKVSILVEGDKGGVMNHVTVRVNERYALDMHIDTDDANAFGLKGNEYLKLVLHPVNGGL